MNGDGVNWFLTALFNPVFLALLVGIFFLGKLVGWMTRNINVWKFLALGYFGVFLFRPLQDAGLLVGGVFILGVASMYMDLFRGIFGWAGGFGDVVSALRFRGVYEDIRRLERENEELKQQLRASQMSSARAGESPQQASWRKQSEARRAKSKTTSSTDGRGDNGGEKRGRGSYFSQSAKSGPQSKPEEKRRTRKKNPTSSGTTSRQRSKSSDGSDGNTTQSTGPSSSHSRSNGNSRARSSRSQSGTTGQDSSSSQRNQQSGGNQQQSSAQNGSGASGSSANTTSSTLRDKHLQTLELTPGKTYSQKELKAAWRKMVFKTHPDKGGSSAAFLAVQNAYSALT